MAAIAGAGPYLTACRSECDRSPLRVRLWFVAVPSAAPGNLTVTFAGSETVVVWSPLPPELTNGRITGYTVTVRSADPRAPALASSAAGSSAWGAAAAGVSDSDVSLGAGAAGSGDAAASADSERTYHVSQRRLVLAGRPTQLRVRVAAVTAAGRGPFSPWWRAAAGSGAGSDSGPGGGDGEHAREVPVTGPPLTVTATVPRHAAVPQMPTWLVAVLCCVGFFALGAGVLALHCHRLRKKQSVLAGTTRE